MHTRSAKSKITGKFTVAVIDWNGIECFRGEFDTLVEADQAAAMQERSMTARMQAPQQALTIDEIMMSDDDLLRELTA
jgi:hypothetical protein